MTVYNYDVSSVNNTDSTTENRYYVLTTYNFIFQFTIFTSEFRNSFDHFKHFQRGRKIIGLPINNLTNVFIVRVRTANTNEKARQITDYVVLLFKRDDTYLNGA